jgi:hypothetical protein
MSRFPGEWINLASTGSKSFICGHCGSDIASDKAYTAHVGNATFPAIFICHSCNKPTYMAGDEQTPGPSTGKPVKSLPADIDRLYDEIRKAASSAAYSAAVMAGRKLLMHVAVEKGAPENKTFVEYVAYLNDNHYIPTGSDTWVDQIRQLGNDANHEITIMGPREANLILNFLEMLLKVIYEFPSVSSEEPTEVVD